MVHVWLVYCTVYDADPLSLPLSPPLSLSLSLSLSLVQQSKIIVLNPTLDDKGSVVAEEGTLSV